MADKFSVTYEIFTSEDSEADERGFVLENVGLREAFEAVGGVVVEADCWPVAHPRWFTNFEYGEDYRTGARETRALHLPPDATPASARRVARLLGLRTP